VPAWAASAARVWPSKVFNYTSLAASSFGSAATASVFGSVGADGKGAAEPPQPERSRHPSRQKSGFFICQSRQEPCTMDERLSINYRSRSEHVPGWENETFPSKRNGDLNN